MLFFLLFSEILYIHAFLVCSIIPALEWFELAAWSSSIWSLFMPFEPFIAAGTELSKEKDGGLGWYTVNLWFPKHINGVKWQLLVWAVEFSAVLICSLFKSWGLLSQFVQGCCCSLGDCCARFDFLSNGNPVLHWSAMKWPRYMSLSAIRIGREIRCTGGPMIVRGCSPSHSFVHLIEICSGKFVRDCFLLSSEFCCWWFNSLIILSTLWWKWVL